jgi:4-alpha-glucanotransferase
MTLGLAMVACCKWRLGHQRPDPGVVGIISEVGQLLVGDAHFGAQLFEPSVERAQSSLEQRIRHRDSVEVATPAQWSAMTDSLTAPAFPDGEFGVVAQVFSMRSERSWGVGGFAEIAQIGHWLAEHGGTVLGLSPLGDPVPSFPREPSPYSTSTRRSLDPLLIDVMALAGDERDPVLAELDLAGRALNTTALIDRDAAWALKLAALEHVWKRSDRRAPDDVASELVAGELREVAAFNALSERFGTPWNKWPATAADPVSGVALAGEELPDRVAFWSWVATVAESQLGVARRQLNKVGVKIMGDLPVGCSPLGADAWLDQAIVVPGMSLGAPPDEFNPDGQSWGLPALDPERWADQGFRSFVSISAANFARFDGLRIDHIMGLFRGWQIPDGADAAAGIYVEAPWSDLAAIVVAESQRAGSFVVGEDLGTVDLRTRGAMAERGIAGTKVALFDRDPERWPADSLGTITTHDLPTVRSAFGDDPRSDERLRASLLEFSGLPGGSAVDEIVISLHQRLGASGSGLVMATLEDIAGSARRVNLPGTTVEYPNWLIPLPCTLEELNRDHRAAAVLDALGSGRGR